MEQTRNWFSDFEIRFCSALTVVTFIVFGVALNLFLVPLSSYYWTPTTSVDCVVSSVVLEHKVPCDFNSCASSCSTADELPCLQVTATVDNSTLPLVAGLFNCGIFVNCTYFKEFVEPGKLFKCEIFQSGGMRVVSPKISANYSVYICLVLLPFLLLVGCVLYIGYRGNFGKARPEKAAKKAKIKHPVPKSFYQRKLLELEQLKKRREERERIARYSDDVEVENLNTVTALVFKPSSSWMDPEPLSTALNSNSKPFSDDTKYELIEKY